MDNVWHAVNQRDPGWLTSVYFSAVNHRAREIHLKLSWSRNSSLFVLIPNLDTEVLLHITVLNITILPLMELKMFITNIYMNAPVACVHSTSSNTIWLRCILILFICLCIRLSISSGLCHTSISLPHYRIS